MGPLAEEDGAIRLGLVGLGYWGTNIARNLASLPACELAWCCDIDGPARERVTSFPRCRAAADLDEMLADESLEAVILATPVPTHAPLAERVLAAGKHCFVEKPLARSAHEAERLLLLARERQLTLMVGHLLAYHPAVAELGKLVDAGELGEIRYIHSRRLNLGMLRADENALWSLGAHDLSMILTVTGETPVRASARGRAYVREGVEDVVFGHLEFAGGVAAHLHVSWLDPHKERRFTVVGSKRMATFDDMELERKLIVYDKGFDPDAASAGEFVTRSGVERSPPIAVREPLRIELEHFVECVRTGVPPRTGGVEGLRVVRVLEALQASLDCGGEAVSIAPLEAPA